MNNENEFKNDEDKYVIDTSSDEESDSLKDKIGCILFIVWFIGSLILMVSSKKYSMIVFGQYFLMFGIVQFRSFKRISDKLGGLLFIEIGGGIIFVSILYLLKVNLNWNLLFPILLFIGAILVGITLILITILDISRRRRACTVEVEATIVDYGYVYSNSKYNMRKKLYSPIYGFSYNNDYYKTSFPYFNNFSKLKNINSVEKIMINPDDPNEILTIDGTPKFMITIFSIVTFVFIIAFIYYCIFVI